MAGRAVRAAESRFPMPQFFAVAASVIRMSGAARAALFFAPWLAKDPLRPSAGRAEPDPVTSDALCRPAALTQEGSMPSRSLATRRSAPLSKSFLCAGHRRGQDAQCRCLFKASGSHLIQDAFHRLDARPCDRAGATRATCSSRSRSRSPAPLSSVCEPALPVSRKEPPHRPTLPHLDAPRGPPRYRRQDASHRLLQPTFPISSTQPRSPDSQARSSRCGDRVLSVSLSRASAFRNASAYRDASAPST